MEKDRRASLHEYKTYKMPPIQIQSDKPINTASATEPPSELEQSSSHPPARPGAAPGPAPTGAINQPFPKLSYAPPAPTPTQTLQDESSDGPPPPQPGAVPIPPSQQHPITAAPSTLTPRYGPPSQPSPRHPPIPAQFNLPPPTSNQAPTHSTTTYQPPSLGAGGASSPTSVPGATQGSIEHPPGYEQNPYADTMSAEARARQEREVQGQGGVLGGLGVGGNDSGGSWLGSGTSKEGVEGAWEGVKGFLGTAGKKLAEVEGEVWKRVNGKE